jgi:hypothetical protein
VSWSLDRHPREAVLSSRPRRRPERAPAATVVAPEEALGTSREVDAWFESYENPNKDVVQRIRAIVLAADPRIEEFIKWKMPTFTYLGDIASFYPRSRHHATLMFYEGSRIPGEHPRLQKSDGARRLLTIASVADANSARPDIERIVKAWCAWRDADAAAGAETGRKGKAPGWVRSTRRKGRSSSSTRKKRG